MDFSEKYIKMCEKAKEIQKEWKPKEGDYVVYKNTEHLIHYQPCYGNLMLYYDRLIENWAICDEKIERYWQRVDWLKIVWLPRQNQLQEILNLKVIKYGLLNKIDNILYKVYKDKYISGFAFDSFEQLFLALVMYKKYGKIWDNKKEEWIKEEER